MARRFGALAPITLPKRAYQVLIGLWLVTGLTLGLNLLWLRYARISFDWGEGMSIFGKTAIVLAAISAGAVWKRQLHVFMFTQLLALLLACMTSLTMASYLGATLNLPLIDPWLIQMDNAMGLDWRRYAAWLAGYPTLAGLLSNIYALGIPQVFILTWALSLTQRPIAGLRFVTAFFLASIPTVTIATLWPAVGSYLYYNIDGQTFGLNPIASRLHEHDLIGLRNGTVNTFPLMSMKGLITFPSFHAAMAIIFIWASWPLKRWFPFSVVINILMLWSTPVDGGHFFTDLIGGLLVAAAAIACTEMLLPGKRFADAR